MQSVLQNTVDVDCSYFPDSLKKILTLLAVNKVDFNQDFDLIDYYICNNVIDGNARFFLDPVPSVYSSTTISSSSRLPLDSMFCYRSGSSAGATRLYLSNDYCACALG